MKKIICLLLILNLYGCSKTEDETSSVCTSDCTILQGNVITANNEPLSNVNITFEFKQGGGYLPTYTRLISDLISDENGGFYDEFYLKDREIDQSSPGNLILRVNENDLNLNENIITPDSVNIYLERWFDIENRDTIIEQTYYFPKKAHVVVNLNNFVPIEENDRFELQAIFPYGLENPEPDEINEILETIYVPTNGKLYKATEINNPLNVIVAENENNIIRVFKTKNGVFTTEDIVININSNSPEEITLDY